jgi:serine/threonine protein kinase
MPATVQDVLALLTRSRLHPPARVQAIGQQWLAVARRPDSASDLIGWMVAREFLTPYQAKLLAEGKPDNFFLHQYKILDRIGKGRMAGVYKALNLQGQPVAMKVLPPSKAQSAEVLGRFQREATLAAQLDHPNIVRTLDHGECRSLHYLVMEYLEGDTLEELLEARGTLGPREVARIAFLTTLGLQHVHEKGMVHRDLKPGNLMLTPSPLPQENTLRSMVKILDIGLGRMLFDPESREGSEDLTSDGAILGSPDYMAPEQARDPRRADIRADLYALGCTMYHALTGKPPFPDDNLVRQILKHASQEPAPLPTEVPKDLAKVVMTLLIKDPAKRYPTPNDASQALKGCLATAT